MVDSRTQAPHFTLPDQEGRLVSLGDLAGHWVVMWWFPKASTPGCSLEGRTFQERLDEFEELGVRIVGASYDAPEDNRAFAEDQGFRFPLLCDTGREVGPLYGAQKDSDEPFPERPRRVTVIIAPDGTVARTYQVSGQTDAHVNEVLADLRTLIKG
jgi:peroxiredoxin Q/BCP